MSLRKSRKRSSFPSATKYYVLAGILVVAAISGYLLETSGNHIPNPQGKPVILYVNQDNGFVNESNFGALLNTAQTHGFNTIFFMVYSSGTLLFTSASLSHFVVSAHRANLVIYFALVFSNSSQTIPRAVYGAGEDGISLDMSSLSISAQTSLFGNVTSSFTGKTAITTTDPTLPLNPTHLVLETYYSSDLPYIRPGIIASVEVVGTANAQTYVTEVNYALTHSDGVMVFDYAGLLKTGY